MAISRFVLKTHAGIDRPAIMTALPTVKGHCHMLDLGANVDSEARHLLQFAQMGSLVATANEPEALAEAIRELYVDRKLRESMGRWGRLWVENEWSMSASYRKGASRCLRFFLYA